MACFDLLKRKSKEYGALMEYIDGIDSARVLFIRACGALDLQKMQNILDVCEEFNVNYMGGIHSISPLHIMALKQNAVAGIELLLQHGADVGILDKKRRTPLHCAARQGRVQNMIALLNAGSNVNAPAKNGDTPLMVACRNGHEDAVQILLDNGADPWSFTTDFNWSACHFAACNSWEKCMIVLFGHERAFNNALLRFKSSKGKNLDGETTPIVRWPIDYTRLLSSQIDKEGRNPLHIAARNGHSSCLHTLITGGADVTMRDNNGLLPLHLAAKDGQTRSINLLLEAGSNPTVRTNDEWLPIQFAAQKGHKAAALVLLDCVPSHISNIAQLLQNEEIIKSPATRSNVVKVIEFLSGIDRHRTRVLGCLSPILSHLTLQVTKKTEKCAVKQDSQPENVSDAGIGALPILSFSTSEDSTPSTSSPTPTEKCEDQGSCWEDALLLFVSSLPPIYIWPEIGCKNVKDKCGVKIGPVEGENLPFILDRVEQMWNVLDPLWTMLDEQLSNNTQANDESKGKQPMSTNEDGFCPLPGVAALLRAMFDMCEHTDRIMDSFLSSSQDCKSGALEGNTAITKKVIEMMNNSSGKSYFDWVWDLKTDWTALYEGEKLPEFVSSFFDHEKDRQYNAIFDEFEMSAGKKRPLKPNMQMCRLITLMLCHSKEIQSLVHRNHELILGHFDFILRTDPLRHIVSNVSNSLPFKEKEEWLRKRLFERSPTDSEEWMSGSSIVGVDRSRVFSESCSAVLSVAPMTLRGLRVQFSGEVGVGIGVRREWLNILSQELFNPDYALFTPSEDNAFQPNPQSYVNPDHLNYFHFAGRLVGMSIAQGDPIDVHFTRPFYKHILGIPVNFDDLAFVDAQYHKNLQWMLKNSIEAADLDVNFVIETDWFGDLNETELIEGGRNIAVTDSTKLDYVNRVADLRVKTAIKDQTAAFLEGLYSLVPPSLLCIFNEYELELLVAGLPDVDVKDWKEHAMYTGGYSANHPTIEYFWDTVSSFKAQQRAMLLQFVTGSSRVPPGGFGALKSPTGPLPFTIARVELNDDSSHRLPTASTCFNLLKLPEYSEKDDLSHNLELAVKWGYRGFAFA